MMVIESIYLLIWTLLSPFPPMPCLSLHCRWSIDSETTRYFLFFVASFLHTFDFLILLLPSTSLSAEEKFNLTQQPKSTKYSHCWSNHGNSEEWFPSFLCIMFYSDILFLAPTRGRFLLRGDRADICFYVYVMHWRCWLWCFISFLFFFVRLLSCCISYFLNLKEMYICCLFFIVDFWLVFCGDPFFVGVGGRLPNLWKIQSNLAPVTSIFSRVPRSGLRAAF